MDNDFIYYGVSALALYGIYKQAKIDKKNKELFLVLGMLIAYFTRQIITTTKNKNKNEHLKSGSTASPLTSLKNVLDTVSNIKIIPELSQVAPIVPQVTPVAPQVTPVAPQVTPVAPQVTQTVVAPVAPQIVEQPVTQIVAPQVTQTVVSQVASVEQPVTQTVEQPVPQLTANQLTNLEILNHVKNIIKNIDNKNVLNSILSSVSQEMNESRKALLISIFEITVANPVLVGNVVVNNPKKIYDLISVIKPVMLHKASSNPLDSTFEQISNIPGSDMKYTQMPPEKYKPPLSGDDLDWDTTGYVLLDPKLWRPPDHRIRDDYAEGNCPICPNLAPGYPVNVLEYDKSRYVMPSDNISVDYVKLLNSKKF